MELSAKVLREVEFRDRLRGYDTDEVDEFLEKVAVAVDEMQEKMRQLVYRAERAERSATERSSPDEDDDTIRRTLILAQRTADMAVREAQEQAAVLMDGARSESDKLLSEARESAGKMRSEAERRHSDEMSKLERQRDKLTEELRELSDLLDSERKRLADSLRAALRYVERKLPSSDAAARVAVAEAPGEAEIDAQISEDAKAAGPAEEAEELPAGEVSEAGRATLSAVPPLEDYGPPTEAWQPEAMSVLNQGGQMSNGTFEPRLSSGGTDWIA